MSDLLYKYRNGNANVTIYSDGTRICETEDDEFEFDFPCNMDIKITNYCTKGCPFCHENSTPKGKHAPLENFDFINSWSPGVEAALGGGMVTSHPQLAEILTKFSSKGIIVNTTLHQDELIENFDMIKKYQKNGLIRAIGVSLHKPTDGLAECINQLDNVVVHVINGIVTPQHFDWIRKNINDPKVLILGYKHFRRGNDFYDVANERIGELQRLLYTALPRLLKEMNVVSFDNLALEQLNVKRLLTQEEWDLFYQGDEGSSNMYIDAVEGKFAQNSTAVTRYDLKDDVKEMFNVIRDSIQ